MNDTWVLVADSARARLFAVGGADGALHELETFVNPDGRAPGRELVTDRPPRANESVGSARHAIEPRTSPQEIAIEGFARELCALLERGRVERRYAHLVLIAPPAFLGALHTNAGQHVCAAIRAELPKNLTRRSGEEIGACLREALEPGLRARLRPTPSSHLPFGS